LIFLIRRAHEYYDDHGNNKDEIIRMLIPNIYVTKLIGTSRVYLFILDVFILGVVNLVFRRFDGERDSC
jgi:hypothetical protein